MAKKRERLQVIRDILKVTQNNRKIKPTRLLYSSNLSPQMFKDYVDELLEKGFIRPTEEKGKKYFIITEKGNNFLEEYRVIEKFVENFGL